jgi:hypothetical protein
VCLALLAAGCGSRLAEVRGKVTRNGGPMEFKGALVTFISADHRTSIAAKVRDDGTYRVSMAAGYGLPPGQYRVAVTFPEGFVPPGVKGGPTAATDKLMAKWIPPRYLSATKSGLTIDLKPEGATFDIDLKD